MCLDSAIVWLPCQADYSCRIMSGFSKSTHISSSHACKHFLRVYGYYAGIMLDAFSIPVLYISIIISACEYRVEMCDSPEKLIIKILNQLSQQNNQLYY